MTQLETLTEKRNELQTKMELCNFALNIQSKIDAYRSLNDKLHEIRSEIDPDGWLLTYAEQEALEKKIMKAFCKMSKTYDLGINKKSYFIHELVDIWNRFCFKHEHVFFIDD